MSVQQEMDKYLVRKPTNAAAWALKAGSKPLVVGSAPYTSPDEDEVVVQVVDVAINPIDWIVQEGDYFHIDYPNVFGLDVAGEIVEAGSNVKDLRIGQRVIAHCYAFTKPSHGGFQKYVVVSRKRVAELPYSIPTSKGVVLPLGTSTASAGLYSKGFLALPFPTLKPEPYGRSIVIWGGSSSVGSCAIQLAVASGVDVIITASARNFEYCRNLGASQCFDYHDDDVENQVVEALKGKTVAGALHVAGDEDAVRACARIVDRAKGKAIVVTTLAVPEKGIPSSVRTGSINSTQIFNTDVGPYIWRNFLPKALESGAMVPKPDPLIVGEELQSIQYALNRQKQGVSAAKVVVTNIS